MSISFRYLLRLTQAYFKKFKGLLLLGFLFGILFFLIIKFIYPQIFYKNIEIIGVVGKYKTNEIPDSISYLISNGLTKIDASGSVEPNLAKIWETPDKGKTWIFHIDPSFKWQDGSIISSSDILYNFSDADIDRPDNETIIFKLKNEYAPFPNIVSQPIFKKGFLGTGEWKVKKLSLSGSYIQSITIIDNKKNKKIFNFYPTEDGAKLALKLGKVNILDNFYSSSPFNNWNTFKITQERDYNKIVTLFFNTKDNILSDKSVRQALSYAINKDNFPGIRAISPISLNSWAFNPQVKPYNYDNEKAMSLLSDLPNDFKSNMKVDIVTTYILLPIAEQISKDWNSIGVKSQVLISSNIPTDYQTFLAIFEVPSDPDQYTVWHSTQSSSNFSKYNSARIDKLLEDGRSQLNIAERKKIYLDFQRYLNEDAPAAFLYYPYLYRIERK